MSGKDKALDWGELERIAREATPGPWSERRRNGTIFGANDRKVANVSIAGKGSAEYEADLAYLATFDPPTVLRLLQERRELVEAAGLVESVLGRMERAQTVELTPRTVIDLMEALSVTRSALSRSTSSPEGEEVIPGVGP